jgi:hypothetical protein
MQVMHTTSYHLRKNEKLAIYTTLHNEERQKLKEQKKDIREKNSIIFAEVKKRTTVKPLYSEHSWDLQKLFTLAG